MIRELVRRYKHYKHPLYFPPLDDLSNNSYTNCLVNYARIESEDEQDLIRTGFIFPVKDYSNYQILTRDQTSGKLFTFPADYLDSVKDAEARYILGIEMKRFGYTSMLVYGMDVIDTKRAFRTILKIFKDFCMYHVYDSYMSDTVKIYCYQMLDQCVPIYTRNKYIYYRFYGDLYDPKEDNIIYTYSAYEFTTFNKIFDQFVQALKNQTIYN